MSTHIDLGTAPGQPILTAGGEGVAFQAAVTVLPELEEAAARPRTIWRHPAFIVSLVLAGLAVIAAAVMLVLSLVLGGSHGAVSDAALSEAGGNLHLTWNSSGAVELYVLTGSSTLDASQLVVGTDEAWIPSALGVYDQSSCFVIRPQGTSGEVSAAVDALAAQGAASVCVRDAASQ